MILASLLRDLSLVVVLPCPNFKFALSFVFVRRP